MLWVDLALRVRLVRDPIGCECEQHVARGKQAASQQGIPTDMYTHTYIHTYILYMYIHTEPTILG